MAHISTVICTSHTPFILSSLERWLQTRKLRRGIGGFAPGLPVETQDELEEKKARIDCALGVLRDRLVAAHPDVLLVFGDDQHEQFRLANFPAFGLYLGAEFSGFKVGPRDGPPFPGDWPKRPHTAEHWATVAGSPAFARHLLAGLIDREFDVAFSTQLPDEERGMGHAIMRPHTMLDTGFAIPTIPIRINCYYGPQPSAIRCYRLGLAVRDLIATFSDDVAVAVIGSGGLWHTPSERSSILDETFDRTILEGVRAGDARAMAEYFDSRRPAIDPADAGRLMELSGGTGVVNGLGSGTGETRNWIAASATVDGSPGTVVDYIPIYASPVGVAFAYWQLTG